MRRSEAPDGLSRSHQEIGGHILSGFSMLALLHREG